MIHEHGSTPKCINDQDQIAKRRIEDALCESEDDAATSGDDDAA